jgi:hypothetical protein
MELDEDAKKAVSELGDAINAAVGESFRVTRAIERLREIGYEPNLTLKLEIGLNELSSEEADDSDDDRILDEAELELTDDDLKTLRSMKIKISE